MRLLVPDVFLYSEMDQLSYIQSLDMHMLLLCFFLSRLGCVNVRGVCVHCDVQN